MSVILQDIFDSHQDTNVSMTINNDTISRKLMSKDAFVKIVTKIVQQTSTGSKFKSIDELHDYLSIHDQFE